MELEDIKGRLSSDLFAKSADATVVVSIEKEISKLDGRIARRKVYGTITLALSAAFFVLVAWGAYRMDFPGLAISGILISVATLLIGIVALHRMQYVPSRTGLTVFEAQREQLLQVRREITFYRRYSPWFFAGVTLGGALLCIGVLGEVDELAWSPLLSNLAMPLIIAVVSMGIALRTNRDHIRSQLQPLETRLRENVDSMAP